ncbi:MAG: caspase family protein [Bradyrhizobiaceae bacterium]|nr:caspase family protein [Bradyrhizobiaceae bacterium]
MSTVFRFLLVLSFAVATAGSAWAQGGVEPRTALIIGNSAYPIALLGNPVNDATDLAQVLRGADFDVTLQTDADQQNMQEAVHTFAWKLKQKGGVGLFYFAGHGMQINGENYILPIMQGEATDEAIRAHAVGVDNVGGVRSSL